VEELVEIVASYFVGNFKTVDFGRAAAADGSADPKGTTQVGLALNTAAAAPHEASKFPREMGGASSSTGAFQRRVAPKAGTDGLSPA